MLITRLCCIVPDTLEVVAQVHSEWDARSLYERNIAFESNQRFPPSIIIIIIIISNDNGVNANQVTVPIGQKPIVRRAAAEVDQLPANTDVQH